MSTVCRWLGLVGIVAIITRSYLFHGIRRRIRNTHLQYMVNCPQCMGFWVGFLYMLYDCYFLPFFPFTSPISSSISNPFSFSHSILFLFNDFVLSIIFGGLISLLSAIIIAFHDNQGFYKTKLINELSSSDSGVGDEDADI